MTSSFTPKMTWEKGGFSALDRYIKFHLVRAPIEDVLPLCVALVRVEQDGAVLTEGVTEPPYPRHERLRQAKEPYWPVLPGYLVSSPIGRPELTLIECPPAHSLRRGLVRMAADLDLIAIESSYESASVQFHGFDVCRNGEVTRHASIEKGFNSTRWEWNASGNVEDYEQPEYYSQRAISKRITRPLLLDYARAWGLDPQHHLFERKLEKSVLIDFGTLMSAGDTRPRTTLYEDAYRKALDVGIGEAEPGDGNGGQRAFLEETEKWAEWQGKAARAFNRLMKKSDVTVEQVAALHDKYERMLLDEVDPLADPHPLDVWAADRATGIDPMHPQAERLRTNAKYWKILRDLSFRMMQMIPDEESDKVPGYYEMQRLSRLSLDEARKSEDTLQTIFKRNFFALCAEHGLGVSPDAPIPGTKEAQNAAFRFILQDANDGGGLN